MLPKNEENCTKNKNLAYYNISIRVTYFIIMCTTYIQAKHFSIYYIFLYWEGLSLVPCNNTWRKHFLTLSHIIMSEKNTFSSSILSTFVSVSVSGVPCCINSAFFFLFKARQGKGGAKCYNLFNVKSWIVEFLKKSVCAIK